jgi:outer membrane protein assembly factor BamB
VIATLLAAAAFALPAPHDWTRFGYDPARSNAVSAATGITAANAGRLRRQRIDLDGTVDSSPIFLHDVDVAGARRDAFFVTTTYGKTAAVDASTGRILWRYTPPGYSTWAGTYRITNATPVADPTRTALYAAAPDGRIRKLAVSDGHELWSSRITLDPRREKIAAALNLSRGMVIATTGGYVGDAPPYQGHVITLRAATGRIVHVWNSLCSNRHRLITPSTCSASDSAIWGRAGAVVEPRSQRLLVATGNGPWNGRTNWGDSALELTPTASSLLQNWTPRNAAALARDDADLGSTSPALLGGGLVLQGGKDGKLRLLRLSRMNGTRRAAARTGGEIQTVGTPGGTDLFTAPAVLHADGRTWVFVADAAGTSGYRLAHGRLIRVWARSTPGTSPVVAGGLLYVYDPSGGLRIMRTTTGATVATLAAGAGHWNSPIVVAGRVALAEGNANDHRQAGVLDIYRLP